MSHSNFGVFDMEDPLDDLVHETIANLKNPASVPPEHYFRSSAKVEGDKSRVRGLDIPEGERYVEE